MVTISPSTPRARDYSLRPQDRKTKCLLLTGPCINGLYPLHHIGTSHPQHQQLALLSIQHVPALWHRRLGHPSSQVLATIAHNHPDIKTETKQHFCNNCKIAKSHRLPSYISQTVTLVPLFLVHADVWGPFQTPSNKGYKYYVSFIDDFSKYTWVYPLFRKSEVFNKFVEFQHLTERQFNTKIHILRTDNGGEFINDKFKIFCTQTGIIHQSSCPHSPSQNGVAERKHRHLIETTRTLLLEASLPHFLWVDTMLTATFLINRLPSPNTQNKSPYELLYHTQPDYKNLRVFGCLCYPWLKPYSPTKLSQLSTPCIFIGYPCNQKGYRCLDPHTNKVYTSCHVVFNENIFPYSHVTNTNTSQSNSPISTPPLLLVPTAQIPSTLTNTHGIHTSSTQSQSATDSHTPIPSYTPPHTISEADTNASQPPAPVQTKSTHHMTTKLKSGISTPRQIFDLFHTIHPDDPTSYTQAVKTEHWRQAMSQEFQALQAQGTWELVKPEPHYNVLGCRWTFRTKFNSDGTIARYKARLVAKGYNQEHGIDYTETFSPVAKMPTIRVLILTALHYNWNIHQLDVSNAFLHGTLSENVYMQQPQGFQDSLHPNHVCKLKKALYGLKQSPREWYSTLSTHLLRYGFKISNSDQSLLTYKHGNIQLYILIYVDDILLTGNSPPEISRLLTNLQSTFQMRLLGSLSQFLGIQTVKTKTGLLLHQQPYARKIIERAGMSSSKPVSTPLACKYTIRENSNAVFINPNLYRQLIGSLQYLTLTRPDIQFAVHQLSQHMQQPLNIHNESLKRLLRYIQGTTNIGIKLNQTNLTLRGYVDADWASDTQDRKSISGYCNLLGDSLISWQVKKQTTIARSSTEAEYCALASEASEILWLRRLLEDFNIPQQSPTLIYCDNTSAIALANNPIFHSRTKHIDVDCHFIRDCISKKILSVHHICTNDQLADIFTKPLTSARFQTLSSKLISSVKTSV
ncbi:Retrovirus-related Pol polyprotein from transposon TNT 1-94 [Dendrobium catenatum]|uniref:Retrovirus-related Pol polyprotein from transposon TNT 1-94 n=1 Tax=Dendrobium catenatum TaxID=906689 RepID=A0A2I0WI29_9ASPA|nr:Retrovirus-related Pol polyprotein from transposon TNT 1-94 [Dendrobium catenatum]